MKLPEDPHRRSLSVEETVGEKIGAAARTLLPWRVHGRRAGYHSTLSDAELEMHTDAREELVEQVEEAIDFLSCVCRPDQITETMWTHWAKAFQGLSKNSEMLLDLGGEDFRRFHVALHEFGHSIGRHLGEME